MRVLIADEHWISRAGLSHLLSLIDSGCEVREATSFETAAEHLTQEAFDACLVDPVMASGDPFAALKDLREAAPSVPLVVVTSQVSRLMALRVIECGAQGFIPKSASADEIRRIIERVLAGEIALPANLRELPPGHGTSDGAAPFAAGDPVAMLTARQRDVLNLIATGKRNSEIARVLKISPRTVQIHVSTILKLLGVSNRTEAALLARRHGAGSR